MKLEKYKLNNAKGELDLVFPSIEHKQQVMGYLKRTFRYWRYNAKWSRRFRKDL